MFDFIRKSQVWAALDEGLLNSGKSNISFQLKTMQDLCVFQHLKACEGKVIGEIGGGTSRILPHLASRNTLYNIEPFEGADNGPKGEVKIAGVTNVLTRLGAFDPQLADQSFDVLFSVSVVEHIVDPDFPAFFDDCVRILKPGGRMYHAIDMYLSESPSAFWTDRWDMYRNAVSARADVKPIGAVLEGPPRFTTDLASNPDNIMYGWKQLSPALDELRKEAQSVSLLIGVQRT